MHTGRVEVVNMAADPERSGYKTAIEKRQSPVMDPAVVAAKSKAKQMTEEEWLRIFGPVFKTDPNGKTSQIHDVPAFKARHGDKKGILLWNYSAPIVAGRCIS